MSAAVTYYQSGKIKKLLTLPQLIRAETIKGLRRGLHKIRRSASLELGERSIGRALFGRVASGAYKNMKRLPVEEGPAGLFTTGLRVDGVAQIQEQGGAIKPHSIRGKGKLKSRVGRISTIRVGREYATFRKGSIVSSFMHPGVKKMPAFPFLNKAVSANRSAFRAEIDKGLVKVAAIVNNG